MQDLMSFRDASIWATDYLGKNVTPSNISYLVQYGKIPQNRNNGSRLVSKKDLKKYYKAHRETKANQWKKRLGKDLNWKLSFSEYTESETTKHVHRLHPYKGKFIPQLVRYFLDTHTDTFKQESFFDKGAIVLDPFCGSGTTLVEASELGLHALGVDVSVFNAFISNAKIGKYDVCDIRTTVLDITRKLKEFQKEKNNVEFENQLLGKLQTFNNQFFPSPAYRYKVQNKEIDEKSFGKKKSDEFSRTYDDLVEFHKIKLSKGDHDSFLDTWFLQVVRDEILFVYDQVKAIPNKDTRNILKLVLSRTIRSCRATTHADLGTLKEPVRATYYCKKHGKICKPLFSILNWWERYSQDSVTRILQFSTLRSDTFQHCLVGDSRTIDFIGQLKSTSPDLSAAIECKKIDGIFSSPPYVGLIDYHEQHAYAYDLFGFHRKDESEIGPLHNGQGQDARKSYIKGISDVLNNCKQQLKKDYNVFLVANDKYGLYPKIAELSNMKIVNEYKRPVLNRVEKDRAAYAEIIFHMKEK